MKKIKIFISLILLFSTLLSCETFVYAAKGLSELQKEMDKRSQEIKAKEAQIQAKESEKSAEVDKRIQLDLQITGLETDIESVESVIQEKENEIDEKNKRIDELQTLVDENKETLKNRIRVTYEYGNVSYLEVLLDSDGFGDLITRMSILKDIITHDRNVINSYVSAQNEMEQAKQTIEIERDEQVKAKDILETKQSDLKVLKAEKQSIIDALNSDIAALEKEEKAAEAEYAAIMGQVRKAQAELKRQEEEAQRKAQQQAQQKAQQKQTTTSSTQSKSNASSAVTNQSTTPAKTGTGQFVWPSAASTKVTSYFGRRNKPNAAATSNHRGIDIGAPSGTNVLAADSGTVIVAGSGRSYGNYVVIDHGNGYTTLYAHNSRLCVSAGQKVSKGQVIAKVGSTGNSTGPHIHFEVSRNGSLVNPMSFY